MTDFTPDAILDATGLNCPEPVMMLHQHVRNLAAGGLLKVIATDPSTRRDIPKFCNFLGHELGSRKRPAPTCTGSARRPTEAGARATALPDRRAPC
jgi:tRNA 2-thiouridine synthesizing protein A